MGGKSSKPIIGYHYRPAFHHGLTIGPIDAFLEFRGGDKTAWQGSLTASGTISVNAPNLWGGEKDQGGIVGDLDVMFGEPTQLPNPYLVSVFGDQTAAWRGFATVAFKGGRYGAMNPYPQKASYKIRRILQGWDGGVCWYPEKAIIGPGGTNPVVTLQANTHAGTTPEAGLVISASASDVVLLTLADGGLRAWAHWATETPGTPQWHADLRVTDAAGNTTTYFAGGPYLTQAEAEAIVEAGMPIRLTGSTSYTLWVYDTLIYDNRGGFSFYIPPDDQYINPAHVLYDSRTSADMGREPTANINDASLRAAADKLFAEGFGICPKWDPAAESVEDFEQRICKLIGGSFTRSLEDGQWYLDLARGDYVLADLPILTDDDILEFKEQPAVLDSAINSVSVRYFDPERKETIVTPPVRALGLVTAFGTIHQTYDCPEIPTAALATRVALMKLLATSTPTRAFDLVTTRRPYAWRPNQYFRLRSPKRGIADMVCIVGEKQSGSLKSGAIRMKAAQDIYSLPATSFASVEPGVDTRPPQTPGAITLQRAFEAPYIEVVAAMSRADLAALPADVGYAMAVAAPPASELDFTMMVAPSGGSYADAGRGEWCATATVVEAAPLVGPLPTAFTLAGGVRLAQVTVGMAALWDDEIVRVDAIDAGAGTITLGRACADTVPAEHAAGARLWFWQTGAAHDTTEYTDAETVDIKLLSNTGSQQLPEAAATAMALAFGQRQTRPYPPANVLLAGQSYPQSLALTGDLSVTASHRDRITQADQLVDQSMAAVGPEAGVTYVVRNVDAVTGIETYNAAGITTWPHMVPLASLAASSRLEVYSVRGGLESWQRATVLFALGQVLQAETGDPITAEDGQPITME